MKQNHEILIDAGYDAFDRCYVLAHVPECNEIAGSGMRHIKECWRLIFSVGGVRHSRAYKTLDEARQEFERVTIPIVAVEA